MPKCTTDSIKAEIQALRASGFKCAVYYLEAELRKRQNSPGKQPKQDTPKHRAWRKASAKYREKMLKVEAENLKAMGIEPEEEGPTYEPDEYSQI